jgi:hypothetical protein
MASIFGTGSPKIKTSAGADIALDNANYLIDRPVFDNIIHENPISGARVYLHKGYRWEIELLVHLYKFAVPATTFSTIYAALYDEVQFFRHNEAEPVCDSSGNVVSFWFKKITPFYLETVEYRDALKLEFVSLGYVDLSKSMYGYIVDDESLDNILDDESGDSFVTG